MNKRAIAYYVLQEYDKALFDLNKAIKLDSSNTLAYYYKGKCFFIRENEFVFMYIYAFPPKGVAYYAL